MRTSLMRSRRFRDLRRALAERDLAWIPFAGAFLEGRPDVSLAELLRRCDEVAGDPAFSRRRNWLL